MRERVVAASIPATPTNREAQQLARASRGFAGIIGQKQSNDRLTAFATLHAANGTVPGHFLITGDNGLGKRTIARAFAAERSVSLVDCEAGSLTNLGDILGIVTNLAAGDVLILKNVEGLHRALKEFLLAALEEFKVDFVVDKGPYARKVPFHLKQFTCIGTALSEAACPKELRDSFRRARAP